MRSYVLRATRESEPLGGLSVTTVFGGGAALASAWREAWRRGTRSDLRDILVRARFPEARTSGALGSQRQGPRHLHRQSNIYHTLAVLLRAFFPPILPTCGGGRQMGELYGWDRKPVHIDKHFSTTPCQPRSLLTPPETGETYSLLNFIMVFFVKAAQGVIS